MLSPLNVLPLLEGWDYRLHDIPLTTIRKGSPISIKEIEERSGWALYLAFLCDDAYASLIGRWKGPGGQWWDFEWYPELGNMLGAVQQDPAGWLQYYNRPFPALSTAGIYYFIPFSGGFQGSAFPFVPKLHLESHLRDDSTQDTASIVTSLLNIEIIDEEAFRRSLSKIIGPRAFKEKLP